METQAESILYAQRSMIPGVCTYGKGKTLSFEQNEQLSRVKYILTLVRLERGGAYIMQLNVSTDYAIRIILYIAMNKEQERISSGELSKGLGIPQSMVLKLGNRLKEEGLVNINVGSTGGFSLGKDPENITLFDIINTFEPTTKINRCLEEDKYCSRFATENCPVRSVYSELQSIIEEKFMSMTIMELLERR